MRRSDVQSSALFYGGRKHERRYAAQTFRRQKKAVPAIKLGRKVRTERSVCVAGIA